MKPYKKICSRKVLEAHAFDVKKVNYVLPDGREREYDLVDHANAVTLVAIDHEMQIYFVSQYRIGADEILLELPAGVLDQNEKPETAARRELREETGMDAERIVHIGGFFMTAGYSNEFMDVFLASNLNPAPLQADEDEFLAVQRIPFSDALKFASNGQIKDGKSIVSLFLATPHVKEMFNLTE